MFKIIETFECVFFKSAKFPYTNRPVDPYILLVPRKFGGSWYSFIESFETVLRKKSINHLSCCLCAEEEPIVYIEYSKRQGIFCEFVNDYSCKKKLPNKIIRCLCFDR